MELKRRRMRIIKFRAWDTKKKCFYEPIYCDEKWFLHKIDLEDDIPLLIGTPIMQFTGLLDKNGKEIYEGDIVIPRDSDRPLKLFIESAKKPFVIKWEYSGWENIDNREEYGFLSSDLEIIGNIYENPELIKP